ncbi:MAG: hypothetical protein ACW99G_03685 [Candidatus Thorarchaeota archaeon]|jgi:hypothetical protein
MKTRYLSVMIFLVCTCVHSQTEFLRVSEDDEKEVTSLDTAIVSYVKANPTIAQSPLEADPQIDLVGAIHVGDKSYYEDLNKRFKEYDVVLYELVAPQGNKPPKGGGTRSDNPIAMLQQLMKKALALEHQLEIVDYEPENFVHADLSLRGMIEAAKKRGEDKITFGLGIARDIMISLNKMQTEGGPNNPEIPEIDALALLLGDKKEGNKLKKVFARTIDPKSSGLGSTVENSIVGDRNDACLKVLKEQLKAGKTKIAIFYGAAHMPDFEKKLLTNFGMKKSKSVWVKAWNLEN